MQVLYVYQGKGLCKRYLTWMYPNSESLWFVSLGWVRGISESCESCENCMGWCVLCFCFFISWGGICSSEEESCQPSP